MKMAFWNGYANLRQLRQLRQPNMQVSIYKGVVDNTQLTQLCCG
jgi:hypothetical protein